MSSIVAILTKYGEAATELLKDLVAPFSATGKTANSLRYVVTKKNDTVDQLLIFGRKFFSTIETGRGPRKSSEYGEFDQNMLEYMRARGIGSNLDDKGKKRLAKFLAYKINKEGDRTYKRGGRTVYTPQLTKLVDELKQEITKDVKKNYITTIKGVFNGSITT